jgi:hypothetical protein
MIALAGVFLARSWELRRVLQFPGLQPSQLYQTLVFTLLFGFSLLYVWRHLFHLALRRWNFNERVLVLGAGPAALSLVREMLEHNDSGFETVGMVPEPPSASEGPARRGAPPQLPRFVRERGPKTAGLTAGLTTGLTAGEAGVAFGERAKLDPSTEAALATLVLEPLEFAASSSEPAVARRRLCSNSSRTSPSTSWSSRSRTAAATCRPRSCSAVASRASR